MIGGGIQGCGVAMELAGRGADVVLFERRPRILDGASRHTEGKIHLGFVYAADDSLRTARLMARGAATFAPALERWLGTAAEGLATSTPFHYVVHRESMRSPAALEAGYREIAAIVREAIPEGAYFGAADPGHVRRLEPGELAPFGPDAAAVFETSELAVEPEALADALAATVAGHEAITVATGSRVVGVDRHARRLRVADDEGTATSARFDAIVNCAWEGRLALDATAGLRPPASWCFRMKYFGRADLPPGHEPLPSSTVVLGPFGDVVDFGDGRTFLSWYPAGRRGWSDASQPPDWPSSLSGDEARGLMDAMADGLGGVVPAAARVLRERPESVRIRGGVIYALGDTDVCDPGSELHERHRVGPTAHGAYQSVDTGKYALAPLFAARVAERMQRGSGVPVA